MAKWGTFNWGSGTHWGSTAELTDTVTWILQVDWNGDGSLDGANEAQYMTDCPIKLGREDYLDDGGNGFDHMRVGVATVTLDNSTGRFDPRNASSVLYPNVKPGKMIQIRVRDNSDESVYTQFTGVIDDIDVVGYRKTVVLHCVDNMQYLADQKLTFDAELFNTTITGALDHLLTQANFPGGRLLDVDAQPVWVFAVNGQSAAQVAHQVADAGLGIFFVDQYGRARYQERNHATSGNNLDQTYFLNDPEISQPWDAVYNDIEVTARRYIKLPAAIIFTLPEAVFIASGNSESITVNYDPSTDVQLKALEANTRADGEGTALTFTASDIDLGLTGGTLTVTNGSGTDGYLLDVIIRGRRYDDLEQKFNASDATSQATYGLRKFNLESPYLQDRNYASGFATILTSFLKDDRASLVLQMRGLPTWQFYKELMQFINFSSTTLSISSTNYQILGLQHDWNSDTGQDVTTTWYLHRTLVDTTAITSSSLETAPRVPPAPDGYDDPGGDPDTIPTDIPSDSPLAGLDHIFFNSKSVLLSTDLDASGNVNWSVPSNFSSDISAAVIFSASSPTKHNITQPGWYEVNVYGYVQHGSNVTGTDAFIVSINNYSSAGALISQLATTNFSMSLNNAERITFHGIFTFPRTGVGGDISYFTISITSITPTPFFVNTRGFYLYISAKRIRRGTETT